VASCQPNEKREGARASGQARRRPELRRSQANTRGEYERRGVIPGARSPRTGHLPAPCASASRRPTRRTPRSQHQARSPDRASAAVRLGHERAKHTRRGAGASNPGRNPYQASTRTMTAQAALRRAPAQGRRTEGQGEHDHAARDEHVRGPATAERSVAASCITSGRSAGAPRTSVSRRSRPA
jgi:hypothetical protein